VSHESVYSDTRVASTLGCASMHNVTVQVRTLKLVLHCVGAAVRNVTVSMHIHMLMVVEHHIDVTKLDSLHSLIVDHVSSWLLVEPHYVTVVKVQRLSVFFSSLFATNFHQTTFSVIF